MGVVVADS
jgi:hypothetical protein